MEKQEYQKLAAELREMKEFLVDCDDGLADEVAAQEKICGRIYKAAEDFPRLINLAEAAAK